MEINVTYADRVMYGAAPSAGARMRAAPSPKRGNVIYGEKVI